MQQAEEHLKVAKRLHFQGLNNEAIAEYEQVLEIDPGNEDAKSGLLSLGVDPDSLLVNKTNISNPGQTTIRTNFFAQQAKESSKKPSKFSVGNIAAFLALAGIIFGAYKIIDLVLNYDSLVAMENVEVQFEKPKIQDGDASVQVAVANYNPAPIQNLRIGYTLSDPAGNPIKEGQVVINNKVPAGDKRNFPDISLGEVKTTALKMHAKVQKLEYKPPQKMSEKQIKRFNELAEMKDADSLVSWQSFCEDNDTFAPAFIRLGRAYAAKSKWKEAIETYKTAIELDPDNPSGHYHMAIALYYNNQRDLAKKEMDTAADIAPEDPEIMFNRKFLFSLKDTPLTVDKKAKPAQATRTKRKKRR